MYLKDNAIIFGISDKINWILGQNISFFILA